MLSSDTHHSEPVQLNIFDSVAAARLRDEGIGHAAGAKNPLLVYAREGARKIALSRTDRTCTADDVQRYLIDKGFSESALGNAAGAVFKQKCWQFVEWTMSERTAAHSRGIRVWRLIEDFFNAETAEDAEKF